MYSCISRAKVTFIGCQEVPQSVTQSVDSRKMGKLGGLSGSLEEHFVSLLLFGQ